MAHFAAEFSIFFFFIFFSRDYAVDRKSEIWSQPVGVICQEAPACLQKGSWMLTYPICPIVQNFFSSILENTILFQILG